MNNLNLLMQGFMVAFSLDNLLFAGIGAILGIIVGALPGIGAAAGISLLLPMTYKMNPTTGIIMLATIYYGNMFGGAYSATLINIPGDTPAMITAIDGHAMAKKGQAGKALAAGNVASLIGGAIGIVILTICGPLLAEVGLSFGPAEIAALIFFALTSIGWLLGEKPIKGLIATGLGILLSTIGVDTASGVIRYNFGNFNLISGISFIPLVIGMFGFSQVIDLFMKKEEVDASQLQKISLKGSMLNLKELKSIFWPSVRSAFLGNFIGFLPGAGATTGSFLAYVLEKKIGKKKEKLGEGEMTGVAVSEAANNSAAVGSFIPLLSLGIPGSTTSAVLLGGLMMWGLRPGPLLFESNPDFVWGLIGSMYIGNIICFAIGMLIIPLLVSFMKISNRVMIPIITIICIVGAYSANNSMFDVGLMCVAGVAAYYLKQHAFPIAPILLAFVLAPKLELSIRQALGVAHGSPMIFFQKPISAVILVLTFGMLLVPVIKAILKAFKKNREVLA